MFINKLHQYNILSYVRDTKDFLTNLDKVNNIQNECLVVTLGVKSLLENLLNNEGVKAYREAYNYHTKTTF